MTTKIKTLLALILITSVFLFVATPVLAQEEGWVEKAIGQPLIPTNCTDSDIATDCGLTQIFQTIVNVSKIILALTGSVALLMFIYGGVLFIIAAGSQEKITKGKEAMKTAAIGVIIILGAFLMVNFTIFALTGGQSGKISDVQTIFDEPFNVEPLGQG